MIIVKLKNIEIRKTYISGQDLKLLRKNAHLEQKEVAYKMGWSRSKVAAIEKDGLMIKPQDLETTLQKFKDVFGEGFKTSNV